jgi:heptosyltransferase-3
VARTITNKLELKPGDRILVSRSDRLGDLILALPFVETIKLRYPECRVDVLASLYASPVLENNPRIDGIIRVLNDQLLRNKRYKKEILSNLKRNEYSVVVVLYPDRHVSHLFYKAGIPVRIGTAGRFHSVLFSHHLFHSRKANRKHEYEYNLDFLDFFRDGETVSVPRVHPTDKELKNARRILSDVDVTGSFVVLHPGSGGSAEPWPLERFVELYAVLAGRGFQVVITGSEEEGAQIRQISDRLGTPVKTITGETDLRTLAALLSLATVVVANSTGPLHLAVAVRTNVVGLYPGKRIMSPVRWGPLGREHRVIQPAVSKCTCPPNRCTCMTTITTEKVCREVTSVFEKVEASRSLV